MIKKSRTTARLGWTLLIAAFVAVAGCSTRVGAPVLDRSATPPASPTGPRAATHVVQAGDTLHRIAQQYGLTVRELADWNALVKPDQLEIGRELRLTPPDGAQVQPIPQEPAVEVTPITMPAPPSVAPPELKTGPKGGVEPYSDEAWAAMRGPAESPAAAPAIPELPAPLPGETRKVDGVDWSWPSGGKVIARFADTVSRKGLDITGKTGDPVLAAAAGKVVYAGTGLRGYGKLVIIKHDANFLSAYAHNDQLLVKEGDAVKKGQQIAKLGSSDSDQPKLHFEIRRQGKPVDPAKYLPTR